MSNSRQLNLTLPETRYQYGYEEELTLDNYHRPFGNDKEAPIIIPNAEEVFLTPARTNLVTLRFRSAGRSIQLTADLAILVILDAAAQLEFEALSSLIFQIDKRARELNLTLSDAVARYAAAYFYDRAHHPLQNKRKILNLDIPTLKIRERATRLHKALFSAYCFYTNTDPVHYASIYSRSVIINANAGGLS